MKKLFSSALFTLLAASSAWSVNYMPKYELINNPGYEYTDLGVATYNVLDYGVDATGKVDCTATVQALLDAAAGVGSQTTVNNDSKKRGWYGNPTGGVVYFPAGTYLFTSSLVIPRGVTIRGDWKRPDGLSPVTGTLFKVQPTRGAGTELESSSFIVMQPSTMVSGITFWYPDQMPQAVKKYPPTVLLGQAGYFGNDYTTVEHCTFVNSYTAVKFNSTNGGGCPNVLDVYGTPLSQGLVVDCLADVGRFDGLHFSAGYWTNSGLPGSPSAGAIDRWLYDNAIGIVMRRNDWSYTCNVDVDGYECGFLAQSSPSIAALQGNPNGHNYRFNITGCHDGVRIEGASNSGLMFTDITISGCEVGFDMPMSVLGPVQLYGSRVSASSHAVLLGEKASPGLMMQNCEVEGSVDVLGGQLLAVNSSFSDDVNVSVKSRLVFVGNKMAKNASLNNESMFECAVSDKQPQLRSLPDFDERWMSRRTTRPARAALYVVTDAQFGAEALSLFEDLSGAKDNTAAIQAALDLAGSEGGGIVYLPTGHYRVDGTLSIPSGVELKGSGDILSVPRGNGSILESYHGRGNADAAPFITMAPGSGLRGLTVNYPEQSTPVNPAVYPYAVRGNADCYIVNLALRTAYYGIDLFTNKCDNHYVDYISGHAYKNVIRVGNNSDSGVISNIQCNTIAYACGDETKFGCWPNSMIMADNNMSAKAYGQNSEELDFMIIGDCSNEVLYNNFLFGCHQGIVFNDDGNGGPRALHSLGNAVDGAVETFVFNGASDDIDLINSQVVAINHDKSDEYINKGRLSATFVKTGPGFDRAATFFSGNFWGGGDRFVDARGGTVNFYSANFATSGSVSTVNATGSAKINMVNVFRRQGNVLVEEPDEMESACSVSASVLDCNGGADPSLFNIWDNNLPLSWYLETTDALLPRTGWRATANNDLNGTGEARNAIDGNASSRWSTEAPQAAGQWFAVDFGKVLKLNTVILDAAGSPNDGPKGYTVEVRDADGSWYQVAEGTNGGSCLIVSFDRCEATAVRVRQNQSNTGYWSIHEFYIADLHTSGVDNVVADEDMPVHYVSNTLHFADSLTGGDAVLEIYNARGMQMVRESIVDAVYGVDDLANGVYIVVVRAGNGSIIPLKIVKY